MVAHANNLSTMTAPANQQPLHIVSTTKLQNLMQYQSVQHVNPTVPTDLDVGTMVTFPVFCQCLATTDNAAALVSYVMQPGDTYTSIAAAFFVAYPQ
ncbi:hypothetical protein ZEAMMB73_Zm00001d051312 [Zea mays]|uniref:NFP second LysM domain-containing protein n=1 Tax=Zea mays TaxID=4577 RepID=A0A1D6Q666_MAIZE|nr:hypothetical protein ZEAMMB73_Zm00001d051312 [Zea mays]